MTTLFKKDLLWTKPNIAALKICKSINKDADIVYVPFYWKIIFIIIEHRPIGNLRICIKILYIGICHHDIYLDILLDLFYRTKC
mgnify:CR=1 FL=1